MYELPSELSSGGGGEVTPNPKASAGEAASDTDKAAMPPAISRGQERGVIGRLGSLWLGAGTGTRSGGEDGGRAAHRAGAGRARDPHVGGRGQGVHRRMKTATLDLVL